jgi:hypothetical protein
MEVRDADLNRWDGAGLGDLELIGFMVWLGR